VSQDLVRSLAAGDVAESARLTEERGHLIRSIDEADAKKAEGKPERFPPEGSPAGGVNPPSGSLHETLRNLLQEAAVWDLKCVDGAQKLRDETRSELLILRQGRRAAGRYIQSKDPEVRPRFMDVKQ